MEIRAMTKGVIIKNLSTDLPGNFTKIHVEQFESDKLNTVIKIHSDNLHSSPTDCCKNITLEFNSGGLQIKKWQMGKAEKIIAEIPASKIYFKK